MDVLLLALRVVMAVSLYVFLGALVLILWRDLRRASRTVQVPPPPGKLVVFDPDAGAKERTEYTLQEVTSVGRAADNVVVLADHFVSAHHALLVWRKGRWWLEDLNSRNGTKLNSELINQSTVVSAGDVIGIGEIALRLELER